MIEHFYPRLKDKEYFEPFARIYNARSIDDLLYESVIHRFALDSQGLHRTEQVGSERRGSCIPNRGFTRLGLNGRIIEYNIPWRPSFIAAAVDLAYS